MKSVNVAVVGATGLVGETVISILSERQFPVGQFYAVASERSEGSTVLFKQRPFLVEDIVSFDFSQVDLAIFCVSAELAALYIPQATAKKCIVIDNSAHYRYDDEVPLIIPEVNPEVISQYKQRRIIANPNCSTIQLLVAIKPIYDAVGIARINIATYQSVSGAGREGLNELALQTGALLNGQRHQNKVFPLQIAFNLIPQIDAFQENGYTKEEMKIVWETQKILNDPLIRVNPTAVRVPVFFGHSEAVHIETRDKISVEAVKELLRTAPGVVLVNEQGHLKYPTPVTHAAEKDSVFVGRVREDISHPQGLDLWIVADNIRKGAALNAVQIAELLIQDNAWA